MPFGLESLSNAVLYLTIDFFLNQCFLDVTLQPVISGNGIQTCAFLQWKYHSFRRSGREVPLVSLA